MIVFPKIKHFRVRHAVWGLTALALAFIFSGAVHYWISGSKIESSLIKQVKKQELLLARASAGCVFHFFQDKMAELLIVSEIDAVRAHQEELGREKLFHFAKHLYEKESLSVDLGVADKNGKVLWVSNMENVRDGEGVSVVDRDYYAWALDQKRGEDVFIGEPLRARGGIFKDQWSMAMAAPLFWQGQFNGVIFMGISLEDLTERLVDPHVLNSETTMSLITDQGMLVASNRQELIGKNIKDTFVTEEKGGLSQTEMVGILNSDEEKTVIHFCPMRQEKRISAFVPVDIDDHNLTTMISLSHQQVVDQASPLGKPQLRWLVFDLIGILLLSLAFVLSFRVTQRRAFLDGFRDGQFFRKSEKKKKK